MTGRVFNIERFATEDGPGIRTVVFLKGCALRCRWCANPESQSFEKEILLNSNLCAGCGRCAALCPRQGITMVEGYGFLTTSPDCDQCGTCAEGCYMNARSVMGADYTPDALLEELLRDREYFRTSGGGVTFSGGEPCFQSAFIHACALWLHQAGVSVLLETCGHVPTEKLREACREADFIFYDFKHIDPVRHKELTGADNRLIMENLEWLDANFKGGLSVRYPYIPGCNDNSQAVESFLSYAAGLKSVREVWFLPYHRLGLPKYKGLGREYPMGDQPALKFGDIAFLKEYGAKYGVSVRI